jgi:hypothetical protein
MSKGSSKDSVLPGFTAQSCLIDRYETYSYINNHQLGLSVSVTPAAVDPDCFDKCVKDCPPSGPQRKFCVQGCRNECAISYPTPWRCNKPIPNPYDCTACFRVGGCCYRNLSPDIGQVECA